jgi:hypothetical protein
VSGGLLPLVVPPDFGRRLLGFVAVLLPVFAGLSFGREVMNAPRTSS